MGRHEIPTPDELVKLDEMDMPGLARLGRMKDHEQVILVGVDLGQMAALEDVAHREGVESEAIREGSGRLLVTRSDIHPNEAIVARDEGRHLRPGPILDPRR
jgi:hypothetical protein